MFIVVMSTNNSSSSWVTVLDTKKRTDEDLKDEIRSSALYLTILRGTKDS